MGIWRDERQPKAFLYGDNVINLRKPLRCHLRYVQVLRCAQDDNVAPSVILSAAKDLYEMLRTTLLLEGKP